MNFEILPCREPSHITPSEKENQSSTETVPAGTEICERSLGEYICRDGPAIRESH